MPGRPASIRLAVLALAFAIAVQVVLMVRMAGEASVTWAQSLFAAAVFGMLLWGIAGGDRLAWLWGRYLTLLLAVIQLAGAVAIARAGPAAWRVLALVVGGIVAPLAITSAALGRRSAFEFFGLVCPECGTTARRGVDFLFRAARCPRCGHLW